MTTQSVLYPAFTFKATYSQDEILHEYISHDDTHWIKAIASRDNPNFFTEITMCYESYGIFQMKFYSIPKSNFHLAVKCFLELITIVES